MARRTTPENERPVTYGAIGATQAVDLLYYPPTGYKPLVREARLGSGRERFDTAAASLMSWGVQRGSGIEVVDIHEGQGAQYHGIEYGADGAPLTLREAPDEAESVFTEDGTPFISNGMEARLRIPFGPFRVNAPVRVMYVINEPRRVGFAYGTLKGHPESGEEAWIVQLRDDDSVWIEVRAISHPSTWFYRLVAPILAGQQRKFTKRYLRALLPGPRGLSERRNGMPSTLPTGDPAPADGTLPASTAEGADNRDFGVYIHVPFCRVRCGYCDFNTYTASELRGVHQSDYAGQAAAEIGFANAVLTRAGLPRRAASTVFFGGGTPTLLPAAQLAGMIDAVRQGWGLAPDAEVTTEANPDSVTPDSLAQLADAGFTRVSFGMQSAVPSVLATLERTHDPERIPLVVEWARDLGLDVSLDLIYGTPGETLADWERSLDVALACQPDHLSAYALIVEAGTKLARQIRSGQVAEPDDDLAADMYEMADARLGTAGYDWYEVSNWAAGPEHRSRHNLAYWLGHDWWGVGPGAHSHVGGTRWWNVKHPAAYAERILAGVSPAAARETLDDDARQTERVLLLSRIADGLPIAQIPDSRRGEIAGLIADGLIDGRGALGGRVVLTLTGRLLADAVVRRLTV